MCTFGGAGISQHFPHEVLIDTSKKAF